MHSADNYSFYRPKEKGRVSIVQRKKRAFIVQGKGTGSILQRKEK
jgi:hypothetical protein